jgi:hypothetical protein
LAGRARNLRAGIAFRSLDVLLAVRAREFDVGHKGAASAWHMRGKGLKPDWQQHRSLSIKSRKLDNFETGRLEFRVVSLPDATAAWKVGIQEPQNHG